MPWTDFRTLSRSHLRTDQGSGGACKSYALGAQEVALQHQQQQHPQGIEDGFQRKPMNRAVMVLLDYSKVFDTVWRSHFLLSMADKGVPLEYVKWINSFLLNR